jgi:hypothetical protein
MPLLCTFKHLRELSASANRSAHRLQSGSVDRFQRGLRGYTTKSFVQSSIRTGATAHPPERTETKNNNKEEFTDLSAAEFWKSRRVRAYF